MTTDLWNKRHPAQNVSLMGGYDSILPKVCQ